MSVTEVLLSIFSTLSPLLRRVLSAEPSIDTTETEAAIARLQADLDVYRVTLRDMSLGSSDNR